MSLIRIGLLRPLPALSLLFFILAAAFGALAAQAVTRAAVEPERMLGQMLMPGFRGGGEEISKDKAEFMKMLDFVAAGKAGGVILFNRDHSSGSYERNIYSPDQVRRLCASLQAAVSDPAPGINAPLLIAVDQEGGRVRRLPARQGFMDLPAPAEMGRMSEDRVRGLGRELGSELRALGINVDFAPALDLNVNPHNPVIGSLGRSFGAEPELVASRAGAFMAGLTGSGIIGSYKHFPGHGSSRSDTHVEFTDLTETWSEDELLPYRRLLAGNGPYMVMLGHLFHRDFDDKYPASLSEKIAGGLLRGQLGWQGVIITDDLQMRAISDHYSLEETILLAVNAGVDILLFGNNLGQYDPELPDKAYNALLKLYREGKISRARIEESYGRIMQLKEWLRQKD